MAHLIDQGLVEEALDLAREFHEWMRAPLGFDHDIEWPEEPPARGASR